MIQFQKQSVCYRKKLSFLLTGVLTALAISLAPMACGNESSSSQSTAAAAGTSGGIAGQPGAPFSRGDGNIGSPTLTSAISGGDQTAPVDTAVASPPRMLVTDNDGDPVPDVEVTFRITEGDGSVTGATTRTGSDGTATVGSWTLGPIPGRNSLTAEVPGLGPVIFYATATADARGSMVIYEGNGQYARTGQDVAVAPAVVVRDASDRPIEGRSVLFAVTSGGGSITGESVTTDAEGIARVGSWKLGNEPGANEITATTDNLPVIRFTSTAVSDQDPVLERAVILKDLDVPWDLAFTPDGSTMFYTLRAGGIFALAQGQTTPQQVASGPADLDARDQSGLLGIAVDPNYANNGFLYTFLSASSGGKVDNRIRKWRVDKSTLQATAVGDILTGISWTSGAHSGGRIRIGPDGFLYITTGDNRTPTMPQDLTVLGGKLLRITTDGAPAPGNPSLGPNARPEIFAYGFRNPQGLAFRPGSGQPFLCEHGPGSPQDDEVTYITPGGNGGWDPNDGNGNYIGYSGISTTDFTKFPNALVPALGADSAGMAGCDFVVGNQWLSWNGNITVGFLVGRRLLTASISTNGKSSSGSSNHLRDIARLRSVVRGPDNALYIVTNEPGEIWRVTPKP